LVLDSATNTVNINADTNIVGVTSITGDTSIIGNLDLTNSPSNEGRISANYLDVPNISPIGSIMVWPGSIASLTSATGGDWRICNGSGGFTEASYPELWEVLKESSGSAGRYGGNSSNSLNVLGNTGGSTDTVLISHNHGITDPGHSHPYIDTVAKIGNNLFGEESAAVFQQNTSVPRSTTSVGTGIEITDITGINVSGNFSTNQTGTNANLPPYMVLYWVIRVR
jgi:hypothetical protein